MLQLRLTTFLTPILAGSMLSTAGAGAALAATTISSATTTPLATSIAGDVSVASGGSITTANQPDVTVDSANSVTVASGGTLTSSPGNNGGGILQNAGTTSTIANGGSISVVESYTVAPVTGTSVASGPIANTTGRYGILVNGAAAGSIANTGTISVKGLGAIGIGALGTYSGTITNTGTIAVIGDNAVGLSLAGVTGDVMQGGSIAATGSGAQGLVAGGDIGGALTIAGAMSQPASYTTDSATSQSLTASQVKTGKALVEIDGNVAKGIVVYAPCTATTTNNVSSCTSTGSVTTAGSIAAVGNNPAMQIGGAQPITIGASAASIDGGTYSLAVDGTVTANAAYTATDATAIAIGGKGGTVALPGGIGVAGTVTATTVDSTATALLINPGATVTSLTNTGKISAVVSQAGGTAAYAVRDLSRTLTNVTNHGAISATAGLVSNAIDLSANTTGVTFTQSLSPYEQAQQAAEQAAATYNPASAVVYTSTVGNILTGTGNDTLAVSSGTVNGSAWLGGGNDTVALSGDSKWTGDLHFGSGSATIGVAGTAQFTGALDLADQPTVLTVSDRGAAALSAVTGGSQLAVTVNGGRFGASSATTISLASLTVNSGGTLNAVIDGTGASSLVQTGTAAFATGAKVSATVTALANAAGTYHILSAGSLTGSPAFDATTTVLPVLFKGGVAVQGTDLYLTIARKSATDLGLTAPEAAGYEAIYANALNNSQLATSLLQSADTAALTAQFDRLLPDYAGGIFDFITRGSRLAARHVEDDSSLFNISPVGAWLEPLYFNAHQTTGTGNAWSNDGFGLTGGMERQTGIGSIGGSFTWTTGKVLDGSWQDLHLNAYELAAFWRLSHGPLYAYARIGADRLSARSSRTFTGAVNGAALTYSTAGHWTGWAITGDAGVSYALALANHFGLRPLAALEYARLREGAYAETGATAIDLAVDPRTSQALTARTTLTAAWSFGDSTHDHRPLTVELEGGRRNRLSGDLGATTASFTGGTPFTITPDSQKSSWLGEARLLMGGFDYTWQLAGGAEQSASGKPDYSLRASLSLAF